MRKWGDLAFSAAVVAVFAWAIIQASGWSFTVKLFPMAISIPMVAVAAFNLVNDVRNKRRQLVQEEQKKPGSEYTSEVLEEQGPEESPEVIRARSFGMLAWLLGSFLIIWFVGMRAGLPLFVFLFLKFQSREKLWVSVLLALGAAAFMIGFFDKIAHMPWPEPLISQWFGLNY